MHFPNDTFDLVICMTNTLGNMPDIEQDVLKEMARVVKPEGKVILSVYRDDEEVVDMRSAAYRAVNLHIRSDAGGTIKTNEGLISRHFSMKELKDYWEPLGLTSHVEEFTRVAYLCEATKDSVPAGTSAEPTN